jgi:3-phosphoshikimate 1-carboxyvinyltransferase
LNEEILLPASKSITNRVLIIKALTQSSAHIYNSSSAKDSLDLIRCLQSEDKLIDVGEGATTLRFLLAYFAVTHKLKILRCSPSLQKRPLKELIIILEKLGCRFSYLENEYQLPLEILQGISETYPGKIQIDTNISSQFASAILLIAPYLKNGLEIEYSNSIVSEPYLKMTKNLMLEFGAKLEEASHSINIKPCYYQFHNFTIESDWSNAAFFYSLMGILKNGSYYFPDLKLSGLQGDEITAEFYKQFGIITRPESGGIRIHYEPVTKPGRIEFDFTHYPDLFPPIALFCAITKTNGGFTGLQNLVHKESNRLRIISDFLVQQQVNITEFKSNQGELSAEFEMCKFNDQIPDTFDSHNDHRIAMSFSLLNTIRNIDIKNPDVVQKSFPGYWEQLKKCFE